MIRLLAAVALAGSLSLIAIHRPPMATWATFGFLAGLALIRRLLMPVAAWTPYDPLLLVAPFVCGVLLLRLWWPTRRRIALDGLTMLVAGLLILSGLEVANPVAGNMVAGLAGLLFIATPLLWFFVGRAMPDRPAEVLILGVILCGIGVALYGLAQRTAGLPPWDAAWLNTGGYSALQLYGAIRPFGTFASSAEYATYLGIALILALAMVRRQRLVFLAAIPVIALALFLDATRGTVVLTVFAVIVLAGLRMGRAAVAVGLALIVATMGLVGIFGPSLESRIVAAGDPLAVHQVGGLLHPLDPGQSTLGLHWQLFVKGVSYGLHNPLGLGTAATNIAADKFGVTGMKTQTDLSNAFVSLGLLGGVLFFVLVIAAFRTAIGLYLRDRDVVALATTGALIVGFGQWLNGGEYAVAPLIWFLIGWADGRWVEAADQKASRFVISTRDRWTPSPRFPAWWAQR